MNNGIRALSGTKRSDRMEGADQPEYGDYYSFYDFSTGLVHFTRNALKETHIFQLEKPVCTLEQWCEHVDDRDVSRLKRVVEDLLNGRIKGYSFNYRVKNCCG